MNAATMLFILNSFNLVMVEQDGVRTNIPAQLVYWDENTRVQLTFLDTVEVYIIDQRTKYRGSEILRLSSPTCTGWVQIKTDVNFFTGKREGFIWFYKGCGGRAIERKFIIDSDRCFNLIKEIRRKKNQG